MKNPWGRASAILARWCAASVVAGFLVGGLEGAAGAQSIVAGLRAFWLGGAVVSALGLPVGLVMATGSLLLRQSRRCLNDEKPPAPSKSQALVAASRLAAAVTISGVLLGGALLLLAARNVTETPELLVTGALGALLLACGSAAAQFVLSATFFAPLSQLDRTIGLPFPRSQFSRDVLYYLTPSGFFFSWAAFSTPAAELRVAAATCLLSVTSWVLFRASGSWQLETRKHLVPVFVVGLVSLAISAGAFHPGTDAIASKPGLVRIGVERLQVLSDVDGDGRSSLWGGGDCAPFDSRRSPGVAEVSDNGIDEDCDGSDHKTASREVAATLRSGGLFSEALPAKKVRHYNVLWLMVDTLRADHLQLLGYSRKNTPTLQAMKKSSLVFSHGYSQSAGTPTSIASMLTGKTPGSIHWTNGTGGTRRPQLHLREHTVAERFRAAGYRTAGFLSKGMLKLIPKTMQGFDDVRGLRGKTGSSELVIDLLNADPGFHEDRVERPFFIFGYYHGAHSPYRGEFEYGKRPQDKYDAGIKRTDAEIARLLEYLRHHPRIWKNTIVVIHSDHGEEFFEHGQKYHNNGCHIESTRVPILVRVPGLKGKLIELPVANVDLVPTLLELTGVEAGNIDDLDGESLLISALTKRAKRSRPILCYQQNRKGDGKIRGTVRNDKYFLDASLQSNAARLFDITQDPKELKDIYPQRKNDPEVQGLLRLIKENNKSNLTKGRWAKM